MCPDVTKERVAKGLKPIYTALNAEAAHQELERFDEKWGARFPVITQAWLDAWEYVTPFLAFGPEVRRVIYTTDESVKCQRRSEEGISGDGLVVVSARRAADRLLCPRFRRHRRFDPRSGRAGASPGCAVVLAGALSER
jgi:hypothetical protein